MMGDQKEQNLLKRVMAAVIATATIVLLFSTVLAPLFSERNTSYRFLDNDLTVVIRNPNGIVSSYAANRFPNVSRGDTITVEIPLPMAYYKKNSSLCFYLCNSVMTLYSGDRVLDTYGQELAAQGRFIGDMYYRVPIPESAWGHSLQLVGQVQENNAFSKLYQVTVMPTQDSILYYCIGHGAEFLLCVSMLLLLTMVLLFLILCRFSGSMVRQGIFLVLFSIAVIVWILGYNGMLFILSSNPRFCAQAEYVALFAAPAPFCLYFREETHRPRRRRFLGALSALFGVLLIAATILNFTTARFHYTTTLPILHGCLLFAMGVLAVTIFRDGRGIQLRRRIIYYGSALSLAALTLELVRFIVDNHTRLMRSSLLSRSYAAVGIVIFIITVLTSYAVQLLENYAGYQERRKLRRLAYVDLLTGVSNRAGIYLQFQRLDQPVNTPYTLLFFDLNSLKSANDRFGHEMGDRLIRYVADCLQEVFHQSGFCGRWGGDEFLAVVPDPAPGQLEHLLEHFYDLLEQANRSGCYPFPVSVSCGQANSTPDHPLKIHEAIDEADHRMYTAKKEYKRTHQEDTSRSSESDLP